MKKIILLLILSLIGNVASAQNYSPTIVADSLYSEFLENDGGESPTRTMLVYLPPGYEENKNKRYPVIYYLHGFTSSDSTNLEWFATNKKLEMAYKMNKIRPFILVVANQHTLYRGSWYTNSSLTGNWADFTAKDLVSHIDNKYRTIAKRSSRGICGWSMGGHGAIKMSMLYPEVYSCAYSMSPALLTFDGMGATIWETYKRLQEIQTREELIQEFLPNAIIAFGRTISPNPDNPPFFANTPFSWDGDNLVTHYDVLSKWYENLPFYMIDTYAENFSKLTAFKMDWGSNDTEITVTSRLFSEKLDELGIEHYAEEFKGEHGNKLWSPDGRMINDVLPFFNTYLEFQDE